MCYSERIDVEKSRDGAPMCMLQYMDMLSSCRIPGEEVDTQRRSPIEQSCHIIVAHNGHVGSECYVCVVCVRAYILLSMFVSIQLNSVRYVDE